MIFLLLYCITGFVIASMFYSRHAVDRFPMIRSVIAFCVSVFLLRYFLYMIISPWYDVANTLFRHKWRKPLRTFDPRVTVLVPAWNEEVGILATIRSLLKSTHKNTEIIIVNDGSTDSSDNLIREFIDEYYEANTDMAPRIDILYHYKENVGKGHSLNRGIDLASGEIVISIDADCVVREDTIKNFIRYFVDPRVMAAVGNVKIGNTENVISIVQYLEFLFSFYFKKTDSLLNTIYIVGGAGGAFRSSIFKKIGVYSLKNITEDIDLSIRIQNAGMRIVYAADAIIYTEGASELKSLIKQRLRWKKGKFQTLIENKHLFFSGKQEHNKILSWFILPLSLLSEVQLFFEMFFILFLYVYSYLIGDFSLFVAGIIIAFSMFFVQLCFDNDKKYGPVFIILAPIGWILFYVLTFVEYQALLASIWTMFRKKEVIWQRWQRQGILKAKAENQ